MSSEEIEVEKCKQVCVLFCLDLFISYSPKAKGDFFFVERGILTKSECLLHCHLSLKG